MCGIAGLIHRGRTGDIGKEMTAMLQSLKHRGPDSTGYALYGSPKGNALVMRWKAAEQVEMKHGFHIKDEVKGNKTIFLGPEDTARLIPTGGFSNEVSAVVNDTYNAFKRGK